MLRGIRLPPAAGPRRRVITCLYRHAATTSTSMPAKLVAEGAAGDCISRADVRRNALGIQMLADRLHHHVFPDHHPPASSSLNSAALDISREHLKAQGVDVTKGEDVADVAFEHLPTLRGGSIQEHFGIIGRDQAEPFLGMALGLAGKDARLPTLPAKWVPRPGWSRYTNDGQEPQPVAFPLEDALVFDVETLPHISPYPVIATAASEKAWYSWSSPWLFDPALEPDHLIPLGDEKNDAARLVIGHNVSYDRARIKDEYSIRGTKVRFLDTLSLHVAGRGLCTRQRSIWKKFDQAVETDDLEYVTDNMDQAGVYYAVGATNSLATLAKYYCNIVLDKSTRSIFMDRELGNRATIIGDFQALMTYCASDVVATHKVFQHVLPRFLEKCPHPVSFAGVIDMGSTFLTVNSSWDTYVRSAETTFQHMSGAVQSSLNQLAEEAMQLGSEKASKDFWLNQLDWTTQPLRMTKARFLKDGITYAKGGEPRPVSRQFMPGYPEWYKEHIDRKNGGGKISITTRTRVAPLLLKVRWRGHPVYFSKSHGWTYRVPRDKTDDITQSVLDFPADPADESFEPIPDRDRTSHVYFKIPHKDGEDANCGTPLGKAYASAFEDGYLSSDYPTAKEALKMNAMCAYWISVRERVQNQFVHRDRLADGRRSEWGVILPQLQTMGTVTRRAVEPTWLTASNAKANRIGSELKAMVRAPPGYKIVGADVDSEELWISSLLGDAQFREHGSTALGWMTLQGTKAAGNDLHSRTASILGISRDYAKIFNYARIYGAGQAFSARLLVRFCPGLDEATARERTRNLFKQTKGSRIVRVGKRLDESDTGEYEEKPARKMRSFWIGGSESYMFNALESIALSPDPRTPVLGCGISDALLPKFIGSQYMTSRVNWVVQSSGVDYLHLLLVSMKHLATEYDIDARFMISIHDEVRFLVKEEDALRASVALQIANLWTRAMFSHRIGMYDLPQSVAFFSCIDVDSCMRKEADLDCVTPSNPFPIPHGASYTAEDLALLQVTLGSPKPRSSTTTPIYADVGELTAVDSSNSPGYEPDLIWLHAQGCLTKEALQSVSFPRSTTRKLAAAPVAHRGVRKRQIIGGAIVEAAITSRAPLTNESEGGRTTRKIVQWKSGQQQLTQLLDQIPMQIKK